MNFLFTFFRFIHIVITLLPSLIGWYRDRKYFFFFNRVQRVSKRKREIRARTIRKKLIRLGTTFIKFGQILSTREDFIPIEYINELSKLQDHVPPAPFKKVKKLLDEEFGQDVNRVFDSIDTKAIASASLAQVHIAYKNNNKLALKILRPGVQKLVETDLRLLPIIAAVVQTFSQFGENNTLLNVISEFSKVIRKELNFINERKNIEIFRENFKGNSQIVVPLTYEELSTRKVLTLEYIEGIKISNVQAIRSKGIDFDALVNKLVKCYLEQVLVHGFFHADPHPGNLLITNDGKIAFLDFGMFITLAPHLQKLIIKASIAGARRDIDNLILYLTDLGILDPEANQEALKKSAKSIIQIFDKKSNKKGSLKIKKVVGHFNKVAQDFSIALPPYLVYLFKASGEVEGLCMRFTPNFTGISYASSLVKEMSPKILEEEKQEVFQEIFQKIQDMMNLPFSLQRIIDQLEEERIRVKVHPKQIRELEAIMAFNARRVLFGILAGVISISTTILYSQINSTFLLVLGFSIASILGTGAITMPARLHFEWIKGTNDDFDE